MPVDGDIILKAGLDTAGVTKSVHNLSKSISKSLKNAIRLGFGVRSVFALIRKLRTALFEGFKDLAQVHEPFNQAMSELMTSLRLLRNTFAAAFAPIIETVAPILSSFINMLAKAVASVGQFIAALTGKEYVQAGTVQINYAESVNKSTKSTNKATSATKKQTKAQKELNKEITHFDDLVILHSNKDEDDTTEPATATTTPQSIFNTMPIGNAVSQFVKDFKAAWASADFTDIGRQVGEKLKNALENIPWADIKATLAKIGKSIATFLNGFMETPGLYYTIGKTVAEGINSAFTFVESFIRNFHWGSWGKAIQEKWLGMLNNIDWNLITLTLAELGRGVGYALETAFDNPEIWTAIFTTITKGLTAVLVGIHNFIVEINWGSLGTNIGVGLNNAIASFNWDLISDTLIRVVNGAIDLLYNFLKTFDFKAFGTAIGTQLSKSIGGINWKTLGAGIALLALKLFATLQSFINAIDWAVLGRSIVDVFIGFFSEFDWSQFGETFTSLILGLQGAIKGAIEEINWEELPQAITDIFGEFLSGFDWAKIAESTGELIGAAFKALITLGSSLWNSMVSVGKNIVAGGFQGMINAIIGIKDWIVTNILDPFIKGFKEAFGISSPSEEMKPYGEYIIEGILEGISSVILTISTWINDNIVEPFIRAVKSMFGIGSEEPALLSIGKDILTGFKDGIIYVMDSALTWLKTILVDPFIDAINSLFGLNGEESILFSIGKNLIGGLKDGLLAGINGIGDWIDTNITTPINGFFESLWKIGSPSKVFNEYGGYLMKGLQNGIAENKDLPQTALSTAKSSMKNIFDAVHEFLSWSTIGGNIMKLGLKAGIILMTPSVVLSVTQLEQSMKSSITDDITSWESIGQSIISSMATGISNAYEALVNVINNISYAMQNSFDTSSWETLGHNIGVGIYNGLFYYSGTLEVLAWNTAVAMYNSACRALSIASPSKKFAWIGEMVARGLGEGVEDNQSIATDAVTEMTDAMTTEAEKTSPSVAINTSIDNWIDSLNDVLTTFSETVIDKFDAMMNTLIQLGNASGYIPAVAQGRVIPSSVQASSNSSDTTANMMRMLENLTSNQMTAEDLRPLLIELFRDYMNFGWYIGDEQLARHVNNGNLLLGRRYSK